MLLQQLNYTRHGKAVHVLSKMEKIKKGKVLDLRAEPPHINLCWMPLSPQPQPLWPLHFKKFPFLVLLLLKVTNILVSPYLMEPFSVGKRLFVYVLIRYCSSVIPLFVYCRTGPQWLFLENRVFSLTWPAAMQIYYDKRKRFHKKRVQLLRNCFGTPTWQT